MTKLSDTQCILLSTASQRDNESMLPLPPSISRGGGATKALAALLRHGLAQERETGNSDGAFRTDGNRTFGLFLTPAGAAAIGVEPHDAAPADKGGDTAGPPAPASAPKGASKIIAVLALLSRPDGATLPELIETTGWLPHTTRAALTGLRRKGHDIARSKRDGATCYRITGEA